MKRYLFAILALILCGCTGNNDVQRKLNEGGEFFQKGDYDSAIQKYSEAVEADPDNPIGYNMLGMAYRFKFNQTGTQEYKDKEIEAFKKSVGLDPKYWVALKNLAASLYYQNHKKEAVPYLEKALKLQPNDPEKTLLLKWIEEGKSIK
ncbi:MAG: tetratricopeptide repeat protein [Kiritimatiellae bacterium]|jgi:tetratricopeptide (TPR) repeat protein|nr:tetratricopeptide repeat protein [Kiritimatiellia bacterium]